MLKVTVTFNDTFLLVLRGDTVNGQASTLIGFVLLNSDTSTSVSSPKNLISIMLPS